jgi:hypothetical protein
MKTMARPEYSSVVRSLSDRRIYRSSSSPRSRETSRRIVSISLAKDAQSASLAFSEQTKSNLRKL